MKKELQRKINTLVEMAGVKSSYEGIMEELAQLEKDIEIKKNKLKSLKKNMQEDKYRNENERIIDENIKIGLENKKQQYSKELEEVINNLKQQSENEEDIHQMLKRNQERIEALNHLLESIELKLRSVHQDEKLYQFYENMMDSINKELNEETKKRNILGSKNEAIQNKLDYYGNARFDLEAKLLKLDGKLSETLESLQNPNSYVDNDLKNSDIKLVDTYNKELEELEKRRESLIVDPVYLAHEAINLYDEDNVDEALKKIKKLVEIVKEKPFMNTSREQLSDLLEQSKKTKEEFASYIANKTYDGEDFAVIDKRVEYLKELIKSKEEEKKDIYAKIKNIDEVKVLRVSQELDNVKVLYDKLKEEYDNYKDLIYFEDESASPRKKSTMKAAFQRKKEELEAVNYLVKDYQKELEDLIEKSRDLELTYVSNLDADIKKCQLEIDDLKDKKVNYTHAKDVLAVEKDKQQLKKLEEDVLQIEHCLKYEKLADEVYNDIVVGISPVKEKIVNDDIVSYNIPNDNFVNLDEFRIPDEEDTSTDNNQEVTLQQIDDFNNNDNSEENEQSGVSLYTEPLEDLNMEESSNEILRRIDKNNKRLKVINVEALPKKEEADNQPLEVLTDINENIEPPIINENNNANNETIEELPGFSILGQDITMADNNYNNNQENKNEEEYLSFNDILNGGGLG